MPPIQPVGNPNRVNYPVNYPVNSVRPQSFGNGINRRRFSIFNIRPPIRPIRPNRPNRPTTMASNIDFEELEMTMTTISYDGNGNDYGN